MMNFSTIIFIWSALHLHLPYSFSLPQQQRHQQQQQQHQRQYAANYITKASNGQVQQLNYDMARQFLDRCLNVSAIHFNNNNIGQRGLPSPVIQSTPRPPSNSVRARQLEKCLDFACFTQFLKRDLRQMNSFSCQTDLDCTSTKEFNDRNRIGGDVKSGMVCRVFSPQSGRRQSTSKFCDCPPEMAYNPLSCKCELAEQCGNISQVDCHNGMKCADRVCSCNNFKTLLFEPQGQFCVEKKTTDTINQYPHNPDRAVSSNYSGSLVAIIVLIALITIGLLALCLYTASQKGLCDRGQYVCDEKQKTTGKTKAGQPCKDDKMVHVAAWDLPGLDVLTEEQTMKYLHREQQRKSGGGNGMMGDADGEFLDDDNLSAAITSTPNSKLNQMNKNDPKHNVLPLKRFGGQQNINRVVNGTSNIVTNGAAGDGSTTCPSSTSSPSSGRSGGGSLPESDRFENPSGGHEPTKSSNNEIGIDPSGMSKYERNRDHQNLNNSSSATTPIHKQSLQSLTMQSNML